jgi:hypothetical protein
MEEILERADCAKYTARWLVNAGVLEQYRVARAIQQESVKGYKAFPDAEEW